MSKMKSQRQRSGGKRKSSLPAPTDEIFEFYIETLICDFLRRHDGQSVSSRDDVSLSYWLMAAFRAVGRMTWEDPDSASEGINYLSNLLSKCEFKNEELRARIIMPEEG